MRFAEKSFTVNGEDHDSPCVFQIWERKHLIEKYLKFHSLMDMFL